MATIFLFANAYNILTNTYEILSNFFVFTTGTIFVWGVWKKFKCDGFYPGKYSGLFRWRMGLRISSQLESETNQIQDFVWIFLTLLLFFGTPHPIGPISWVCAHPPLSPPPPPPQGGYIIPILRLAVFLLKYIFPIFPHLFASQIGKWKYFFDFLFPLVVWGKIFSGEAIDFFCEGLENGNKTPEQTPPIITDHTHQSNVDEIPILWRKHLLNDLFPPFLDEHILKSVHGVK